MDGTDLSTLAVTEDTSVSAVMAVQDKIDSGSLVAPVAPAPQRSVVPWLVVGLLLLLLGGLGTYVMMSGPTPDPEPPQPKITVEPGPAPVPVPVPEPDAPTPEPETPQIRLSTSPAGAQVMNGTESVCVTPCTLPGDRFDLPVMLSLELDGHLTETYELAGTGNHQVRLQEKRAVVRPSRPVRPQPVRPQPVRPQPTAPVPVPVAPAPAPPPPEPAPAPDVIKELEEIKDPFAD